MPIRAASSGRRISPAASAKSPVDFDNFSYAGAGKNNIIGNMGILSTPVIDPLTNVLYLVACTLENGTMAYRLHAVDITSGNEPDGPGVLISGSYQGLAFNPRNSTQRTSLVLADNQVVFGFGAVEAEYAGEGVGWVMAYNKRTLQQSGIFATEPAGNGAGVWQSGRPPAVDSQGYVYVFTGNAYGNGYDGAQSFSETAVKLNPGNGLSLVDWFTPSAWSTMDNADQDLSSSGPLLVPGDQPARRRRQDRDHVCGQHRQHGPLQRLRQPDRPKGSHHHAFHEWWSGVLATIECQWRAGAVQLERERHAQGVPVQRLAVRDLPQPAGAVPSQAGPVPSWRCRPTAICREAA